MFSALATGDGPAFFANVVDDVDWTIMGHSPMSTTYTSKIEFQEKTLKYLNTRVLTESLTMRVVDVTGGGEDDGAAVEMKAESVCKNGEFLSGFAVWNVKGQKEVIVSGSYA